MKKVLSILLIGILVGIIWYLFIKPYDYVIRFSAKTTVGTINQSIKSWSSTLKNIPTLEHAEFNKVKQQFTFGDSTHIYTWKINAMSDSTSRIKVYIKDPDNSLANKLHIPFSKTAIEKRSDSIVNNFFVLLNDHMKRFKVSLDGESTTRANFVAYTPLKGLQIEKAKGMMYNYSLLSQTMLKNNIELDGTPFVEVTKWDIVTDSIEYNFCFPIKRPDHLPEHPEIKYKAYYEKKALKATYNGNYITSDRAWYALKNYADRRNIKVDLTPIEIFYNNPNMGGNELQWKAEVFLPLAED